SKITRAEKTIRQRVLTTEPGKIRRARNVAFNIAEHKIAEPSKLLTNKPAQITAAATFPRVSAMSNTITSSAAKIAVDKYVTAKIGGPSRRSAETARAV